MSLIPLRERHIDRVLSEELETSPEFAAWFAGRVFGALCPVELPSCSTVIGHNREEGETDILVRLSWPSGVEAVIHVEDKIGAIPQPNQGLRYSSAVGTTDCTLAASALVAPRDWIHRHRREAASYNVAIHLEEIADQLKVRAERLDASATADSAELVRRLRWRERLLGGAMQKGAVYNAIEAYDLADWNQAAAEVIAAKNDLMLIVGDRQRSEGRNQKSRFFQFRESLSPYGDGKSPILRLKTAEDRKPGRVSLDVTAASQDSKLRADARRAGFQVDDTKAGTLVISATTNTLRKLTIAKPVGEQVRHLEDAADMAQKLIEWWESRQGDLAS